MEPILKKLNFKDQQELIVLNTPDTVHELIQSCSSELSIVRELPSTLGSATFVIAFVLAQEQITTLAPKIDSILIPDGLFWIAYPKGSSIRFKCDFNRDKGWEILGDLGYEGVRQIAIDEDWSALRFRKAAYIKAITRREQMALSKEGKERGSKS